MWLINYKATNKKKKTIQFELVCSSGVTAPQTALTTVSVLINWTIFNDTTGKKLYYIIIIIER